MVVFGAAISVIGYFSFRNSFENEYASVTHRMADTTAINVNGDHIQEYLDDVPEYTLEYASTNTVLDKSCKALNVSLIYVIKVDTSDYGKFVSIFNVVNNEVDNTNYSPWELGYERKTSNDEYRAKYKSLYEKKSTFETVFRNHTTDGQHRHITTIVPVKDSSDNVTALLCMQRPIEEMEKAFLPQLIFIIAAISVISIFIIVGSTLFINLSIVRPLSKVSKEARRFAKDSRVENPLGKISRYDDIQLLATSIDSMEVEMIDYINNLTNATAEKEKMGAELNIASQIQQSSIPQVFPAFPDRKDFNIYAKMDPAKEVGGDFYNFFLIDEDHIALVIADVSDKGVPAALFMMVTNILISERTKMFKDPAKVLEYVNRDLCLHNQSSMFVTVWLGILEISTGKLVTSNAGHEDPIICHKGKYFEVKPEQHGFVLGALPQSKYQNQETTIGKGDKIFVFTDGVSEAKNKNKEMFGIERTLNSLNKNKEKSPEEIIHSVKADIDEFVNDAPQFDDLTMLSLELK